MRCNNCGWDNALGTKNCVKCGHALQVSENNDGLVYSGGQPRSTIINAGMQRLMPKPTVLDATGSPKSTPRPTIVNVTNARGRECPNCAYPVSAGFTSCPSCGTPMSQDEICTMKGSVNLSDYEIGETVQCQNCGSDVSIDFSFCPKCGKKIHLPTVRAIHHKPVADNQIKSRCSLTLVLEEDEIIQERKNVYEGNVVILNRDNTEPDNRTITSKEQAELSYKDGKWYIINKSELCSTYMELGRSIELQSGDIIVMGDRRFKFESET